MPKLRVNGTELHYEDSGPAKSGETIVFSHGLLWSTELFEAQARDLAGEYRCIRYDHRGQGQSADDPRRCIDMGTVTADAVALIETLAKPPVHFVGLSMGGFVGMRIGARRPELLRSLALLETSADPEPDENVPKYRVLNAVARTLGAGVVTNQVLPILFGRSSLENPELARERQKWRAAMRRNRRSIWRAVNGVLEREDVYPELRRIKAPTLVVVGEEDTATVPAKARRIQQAIAGSRLVEIPRAGHSSPVEQPEAVTRALREFLKSVGKAS